MKLTKLSELSCKDSDCATVYQTDRGTVIVKGQSLEEVTGQLISYSPGETAVEIPAELILSAAKALAGT